MDLVQHPGLQYRLLAAWAVPRYQQRITDQDDCETEILGSVFNVCFDYDEYDMVTVNLAELPSETGTGAPGQGYLSYVIALQQAGDYEDAICYNADSVRVSCNCFQNSFRKF